MIQPDDDIEATQLQMQLVVSECKYLIIITGGCLAPDKKRVLPSWLRMETREMEGQEHKKI